MPERRKCTERSFDWALILKETVQNPIAAHLVYFVVPVHVCHTHICSISQQHLRYLIVAVRSQHVVVERSQTDRISVKTLVMITFRHLANYEAECTVLQAFRFFVFSPVIRTGSKLQKCLDILQRRQESGFVHGRLKHGSQ